VPRQRARSPAPHRRAAMTTYVLLGMVALLVIYLFYAVINPDRF
jgi:K+-transporting ATPase KdpF subunit